MNIQNRTPYEVVASILKVPIEALELESGMGNFRGWDSLEHVSIIGALEAEYKISIPDDELEKLSSMKDIIAYYQKTII